MREDEQICYMAQQLSNVAFTRCLSGPMAVQVEGRLERFVRNRFWGGEVRTRQDPFAAALIGKTFALDYLLRGYQRWVIGPALCLASRDGVVENASRASHGRPGPFRNLPATHLPRCRPTRAQKREGWERRLLAAVVDSYVLECEASLRTGLDEPVTAAAASIVARFRRRWHQIERSVGRELHLNDEVPPGTASESGLQELSRRLRDAADRLLGEVRNRGDAEAEIAEGCQLLARLGSPISIPMRRALNRNADRKQLFAAFFAPGDAQVVEATFDLRELYSTWIELKINQLVAQWNMARQWEILGRLRGDPPDSFYHWAASSPKVITAHTRGMFQPDARLLLIRNEQSPFRRIWVQAEWDRTPDKRDLASWVLEAGNLQCKELVLLTPRPDDWRSIIHAGEATPAAGGIDIRIRMFPFVPDPAHEAINEASIRALLGGDVRV